MELFDAHCHPHHEPIRSRWDAVRPAMRAVGCAGAIVNGTDPHDWDLVEPCCERLDGATPAFGVHPWRTDQATGNWQDDLRRQLNNHPAALVGEIGLDHARNFDRRRQTATFADQLALAGELDRPCCIHCVRAHGPLVEMLERAARPSRFMLHGYSGPAEMVERYARLGAYFSFSPATLGRRTTIEALRATPRDRLLMETDAPYMPAPPALTRYALPGKAKARWHHPANLIVAYETAAAALGEPVESLADAVAANYQRFIAID